MLFEDKNVRLSEHIRRQILNKGFDPQKVYNAINDPERVTEVTAHEGQVRAIGYGMAVVLAPYRNGTEWMAMTVYLDEVVTPLREDQKDDPAALNSKRLANANA